MIHFRKNRGLCLGFQLLHNWLDTAVIPAGGALETSEFSYS